MPVDSTSKPGTSNVRSISSATHLRNQVSRLSKVRLLVQPPTKMFLLATLHRRLGLQLMLLRTRWHQARVRGVVGAMVPEDSKDAMAVQLSTIASPRLPSSHCNKQMPHQSPEMAPTKIAQLEAVQDQPLQVRFQLARTAALLSHLSGVGTTPAISFATPVVRRVRCRP